MYGVLMYHISFFCDSAGAAAPSVRAAAWPV